MELHTNFDYVLFTDSQSDSTRRETFIYLQHHVLLENKRAEL